MSDPLSDFSWEGPPPPPLPRPSAWGTIAAWVRLLLAVLTTAALLLVYAPLKWIEPALGGRRPRARVQQFWARCMAALVGLEIRRQGRAMPHGGAIVANHASWSDILVLLGAARITFVSKAEVRSWPGIGWLAEFCGTVFVERKRSAAKAQEEELKSRMKRGERLLFFPEGTSTDGRRVLPFRSTLYAAFVSEELRDIAWVQPVSVIYRPNPGSALPDTFYGWWADMEFGAHVWQLLSLSFGGVAEVIFHDPIPVSQMPDRKRLAKASGEAVANGLQEALDRPRLRPES